MTQAFQLIGPSVDLVWNSVEQSTSALTGTIEIAFATMVSSVGQKLQSLASTAAELSSAAGFDGLANSLQGLNAELASYANAEQTVRKEVEARQAVLQREQTQITARIAQIDAEAERRIAASRDAVQAALDQADAEGKIVAASTATGIAQQSTRKSTADLTADRKLQKAADQQLTQQQQLVTQAYDQGLAAVDRRRAADEKYRSQLAQLNALTGKEGIDQGKLKQAIELTKEARAKEEAAMDKQADVRGRILADLDREISLAGLSRKEREIEVRVLAAQKDGYKGNADALRTEIAARIDTIEVISQQREAVESLQSVSKQSAESMNRAFDEFILSGAKDFVSFRERSRTNSSAWCWRCLPSVAKPMVAVVDCFRICSVVCLDQVAALALSKPVACSAGC
ncbi:hypothetical protein HC761_00040 [bacterium]|nr:hypothetical protein [bacterium]